MVCRDQLLLKREETNAWTAYNFLKHSPSMNEDDLEQCWAMACEASILLEEHLKSCGECSGALRAA